MDVLAATVTGCRRESRVQHVSSGGHARPARPAQLPRQTGGLEARRAEADFQWKNLLTDFQGKRRSSGCQLAPDAREPGLLFARQAGWTVIVSECYKPRS